MKKMAQTQAKKIGIIGLGNLGGYFAKKFLKKGYQLYACDLDKKLVKEFKELGAIYCSTPKKVAQYADFIFDVTPNDESSKKVWLSTDGILEGATSNKILVVCATLSVDWIDELANICKDKSFKFFDMGINGGDRGLTLLCGGDKKLLIEIKPVLRTIAARIVYFGPVGQGMRYKLILNFLQAVHIIGFAQAMKIANDQKMNLKKVGDNLSKRPGGILTQYAWEAYQNESNEVVFKIELMCKDLGYVNKLKGHLDINLLDNVLAEFKRAVENGQAKKEWFDIVKIV